MSVQARAGSDAGRKGRVLLTGASGLIGSRVLAPLLTAGYEVHALGRRAGDAAEVVWHEADLLDDRATDAAAAGVGAEHLLHLAWYTEHGRFWSAPENLDWVAASLRLLRAFREAGGRRAVIAGTCAEYDWGTPVERLRELDDDGDRGGGPTNVAGEAGDPAQAATPARPATLYGVAKHATRLVSEAYALQSGLSLAWGRVFLLYGPGEDERRLVPQVARALLDGRPAPTSDGLQVRDFTHVDDVAGGFAALLESQVEGPVNIASGEPVTIARVLELIAQATGRPELLQVGALPHRAGEPQRLVADTQRLRCEVGFQPAVALEQGIAETVAALGRGSA